MSLPKCETNDDLLKIVQQSGRDYEVIAKTIYGLEIVCVRTGGRKKPAIVITAGAHAGEPAGVLAALSLIDQLKTDHAVYIIPLRDPFAWGGFARCLAFLLGKEVVVEDHEDAEQLLAENGTVLYTEEEHSLIVSLIGDMVFVSMRSLPDTSGPRDIERRLNRILSNNQKLLSAIAGKRACWPSNLTNVDGCGDFGQAFSAFITPQGVIADLNRQFSFAYPPIEVECVREIVDRVKPGLVLDLHEGQGSKFYLWSSAYQEGSERGNIAQAIMKAVVEKGGELYRLEELAARIDPVKAKLLKEPVPGLIVGPAHDVRQGSSFEAYCQRYSSGFSFEPGRWKALTVRVDQVLVGALAGIAEFEKHH